MRRIRHRSNVATAGPPEPLVRARSQGNRPWGVVIFAFQRRGEPFPLSSRGFELTLRGRRFVLLSYSIVLERARCIDRENALSSKRTPFPFPQICRKLQAAARVLKQYGAATRARVLSRARVSLKNGKNEKKIIHRTIPYQQWSIERESIGDSSRDLSRGMQGDASL